jgi:ribonuclease PH
MRYVLAAMRHDGRANDELRPCTMEPGFIGAALGSVLITCGRTRVICTASLEERPPPWLKHGGWVTAQYAMLPGSTSPRASRDPGGRGKEITRLVGRALRAAVDLDRLVSPTGPLSIVCDCDVIEADGGTRTASITGAFVALSLALSRLVGDGRLAASPIVQSVAAVSVGLVAASGRERARGDEHGRPEAMLDLCYVEDSTAIVDFNVVALEGGGLVEVQGTAEHGSFDRKELDRLLDLAEGGLARLRSIQAAALAGAA